MPIDASVFNLANPMIERIPQLAQMMSPQNIQGLQLKEAQNNDQMAQLDRTSKLRAYLSANANGDPAVVAQGLAKNGFTQEAVQYQQLADAQNQRKDAEIGRRQGLMQKALGTAVANGGDPEQHLRPALQSLGFLQPDQIEAAVAAHKAMTPEQNKESLLAGSDPAYLTKKAEYEQKATETGDQKSMDRQERARLAQEAEAARAQQAREHNDTMRAIDSSNNTTRQMIAGFVGGGAVGTGANPRQATIDAIGQGLMPAPNSRSPANMSMMEEVNKQYAGQDKDHPKYDATNYQVRQSAEKNFATGPLGNQVRQAGNVVEHTATMLDVYKGLKNGTIPFTNDIANRIAQMTGQPAPTTASTGANILGGEITKVIVGGPGAEADRNKAAAGLSINASPEQQAASFGIVQRLLATQLKDLENQKKSATGSGIRPGFLNPTAQKFLDSARAEDSAVPTSAPAQKSAVPDDIAALLAKHGGKK